jgi:type IV secretion system protein VirD4
VRVAFAANKVETAKLISDMVGTMTVHKETRTYTGSRLNPVLMHVMASEQETSRPLLTPDEVMRLPDDSALVFVAGHPAIYARKIRYYADPDFRSRAAVPAPTESDRIEHDWSHWTLRAFPRVFPAVPPEEAQTSLLTGAEDEETEDIRAQEAL